MSVLVFGGYHCVWTYPGRHGDGIPACVHYTDRQDLGDSEMDTIPNCIEAARTHLTKTHGRANH